MKNISILNHSETITWTVNRVIIIIMKRNSLHIRENPKHWLSDCLYFRSSHILHLRTFVSSIVWIDEDESWRVVWCSLIYWLTSLSTGKHHPRVQPQRTLPEIQEAQQDEGRRQGQPIAVPACPRGGGARAGRRRRPGGGVRIQERQMSWDVRMKVGRSSSSSFSVHTWLIPTLFSVDGI